MPTLLRLVLPFRSLVPFPFRLLPLPLRLLLDHVDELRPIFTSEKRHEIQNDMGFRQPSNVGTSEGLARAAVTPG
jgi:hypothetical protein